MEHAPFGNLRQYLRSRRPCDNDPLGVVSLPPGSNAIIMTEEILLRYSLQVAKGMKYLISKEVRRPAWDGIYGCFSCWAISFQSLHCNLCARSVLVFDNDTLKLSNFGVVKESDYHDYYSGATPVSSIFARSDDSRMWRFTVLGSVSCQMASPWNVSETESFRIQWCVSGLQSSCLFMCSIWKLLLTGGLLG